MTEPRERPILFQSAMVRAILAGTKTQTRRLMKPQAEEGVHLAPEMRCALHEDHWGNPIGTHTCPYGWDGDRLWVRETWHPCDGGTIYAADYDGDKSLAGVERWVPSIYMPRNESRLTLEVTSVKVERLQSLGDADAKAEGFSHDDLLTRVTACSARDRFAILWDDINGKKAPWSSNPWVWVVGFRRLP